MAMDMNCFDAIMLKRIDNELRTLMLEINETSLEDDKRYKNLIDSAESLMSTRYKLIEMNPNLVDNRSGMQRFVDRIDPTEIIKVLLIGGFALIVMKHEEIEVISGKAFDIMAKAFRI